MSPLAEQPLQALRRWLDERGVAYSTDKPLSAVSTLGIGGPARVIAEVRRVDDLGPLMEAAAQLCIPVIVLGGGSNSLFPDEGFDGLLIRLFRGDGQARVLDNVLTVDADVLLSRVVKTAVEAGVEGMEGLAGIPGTVGGALVNNAGAYGVNISNLLKDVTIAAPGGRLLTLNKDDVLFGYRTSTFRRDRLPIVRASFHFTPTGDPDALHTRMREIQATRRGKFKGIRANAGSTFKNPTGDSAGRIIEACGLKGHAVGAARMSATHANVLENQGGARATDVLTLLDHVEKTVLEKTGVTLERELEVHGPATAGEVKHAGA